jgi:plasmid stabilization system protein ParE
MISYRFLPPAEEEMAEASRFYENASSGLGNDFLDDVQRVLADLCRQPEIGQPVEGTMRRMLLHRFPFSLIYTVEKEGLLVVAVSHQRRRPDYWRTRVE